jgi:hypothetical protein
MMELGITLKEARGHLNTRKMTGKATRCPCCDQTVKIYKRTITKSMLHNLMQFCIAYPHEVHVKKLWVGANAGDAAKLRHWGLIKQVSTGNYVATHEGTEFVLGNHFVPTHVFLFNTEKIGESGVKMSVRDIVDGFDYDKLMRAFNETESAEVQRSLATKGD